MSTCPVVRVVTDNEDGFKEINEADFDEKIHEIFDASTAAAKKAAAEKAARAKAAVEASKAAAEKAAKAK